MGGVFRKKGFCWRLKETGGLKASPDQSDQRPAGRFLQDRPASMSNGLPVHRNCCYYLKQLLPCYYYCYYYYYYYCYY